MTNIKGIVFDLDGTLIDSTEVLSWAWVNAFKEVIGITIDIKDVLPLIGLDGRKIVIHICGEMCSKKFWDIRKAFDRFVSQRLRDVKLYPGVLDTLKALKKRGIKLALATSTPRWRLEELLDIFELRPFFDSYISGDEVRNGKPNPEIFARAFESIGIPPEEGAVVGDTEYDAIPAKKLGAKFILVTHGKEKNIYYDIKINNLIELLDFI